MAKTSGLGDNFYIAGYDLSGDINSLGSISSSLATLDVTAIDSSGMERLPGMRDGNISFTSYFNHSTSPSGAHDVLSQLSTSDQIITYARGTTLGNPAACMTAKQVSYDPTRADDGDLKVAVNAVANGYGLEWGNQLTTGNQSFSASGDQTSFDLGSTSPGQGFQAYLQVFEFTGTDVTVTIEHSTDDLSFAEITGGSSFAEITSAPTSERITSSSSTTAVNRYVRITLATTGGFSDLNCNVVLVRNKVATVF